ncbi:MAG: MMPL family transporter [Intrasporangiaceae bacterium]|nr:MMPL family transporter [Intrasporangiaceae bacterium]
MRKDNAVRRLTFNTTRKGAWITLLIALIVGSGIIGALREIETLHISVDVPASAESAAANDALAQLPGRDIAPLLVVAERTDGAPLDQADLGALNAMAPGMPVADGAQASPAIPSEDGQAAMIALPNPVAHDNASNRDIVDGVRDAVAAAAPDGLDVSVTGGTAFVADLAAAFDGADLRLLFATIAVVAVLLLITYRSPILWLIPLTVIGFADQTAAGITALIGRELDLGFDAGVVSVLVFGAGTNYALLLISRYREELRRESDHRVALSTALRGTLAPIVASNLTVVLALATLILAVIPSTRGLGIAAGTGLLVALLFALVVLPAALAVCGRRVFWPFIPREGQQVDPTRLAFGRVAGTVVKRPVPVLVVSLAALAAFAVTLIGTPLGMQPTERFTSETESARGLVVLSEHFSAGDAQPLIVVTNPGSVDAVTAAIESVGSVDGTTPGVSTDQAAVLNVSTHPAPGSPEARTAVQDVRDAAHRVDSAAVVGGTQAEALDARDGNNRDLLLVAPIILLVTAIVLVVLLRSLVAPVILLAVNTLSSLGAIGAGVLLGTWLFDWPALDLQVPLFTFLFLVALGIDYTIFLVHRAWTEAQTHGTTVGLVRAVGATGSVITSAGVVLAGVFAALGVLPLITLAQIGLIVGVGVLIDTFLVRTVVVPAIIAIIGDRFWWPARLDRSPGDDAPRESMHLEDLQPAVK